MIIETNLNPLILSNVYSNGLAWGIAYQDGFGNIELIDGGPFTTPDKAVFHMNSIVNSHIFQGARLFLVALQPVPFLFKV